MPETMTALFGGTGPEWTTRQVPVAQPGPGQIVVRARAVALNNADASMLADADPAQGCTGKEYQVGYEFAGEVTAVGGGVDTPAVGERVMGTTPGSFAQYVLSDHRNVLPVPDDLGYEEARALPTGLLTEHGALVVAGFQPGQSVLITGATSIIGLIGVQIARALDAKQIIATTRTAAKRDLLKQVGADTVVITEKQDLTQAVLNATGGEGVDVVLDHVGGQTFAACLPPRSTAPWSTSAASTPPNPPSTSTPCPTATCASPESPSASPSPPNSVPSAGIGRSGAHSGLSGPE
nr:zinc-binding dehydrogenase [Streptomyces sabulosicollis]